MTNPVDKLDFPSETSPLLDAQQRPPRLHGQREPGRFFEHVAAGVAREDRVEFFRKFRRRLAFVCAILSCLCAGSITAFSLYGPLLQTRLGYTQYEVNAVSIAAEIAMYLPVPVFGWLCDRYQPQWLSLFSGIVFAAGYGLAAFVYRTRALVDLMVLAFILVGAGTSCMYLSAVSTCVKNFGHGQRKGLAVALPISAYGLSGMWQSQVGSHLFADHGALDVGRYFVFLAILLLSVGILGTFGLRVLCDERDEVVEPGNSFFSDPTMWLLTIGFFLTTGPGETFINNIGTIVYSTYAGDVPPWNAPASHVSILAVSSTVARLSMGALCDRFAPNLTSEHDRLRLLDADSDSSYSSRYQSDTDYSFSDDSDAPRWRISRIYFLLIATICFALALLALSTTLPHEHPSLLPWISALVGLGYGSVFALTPIIISAVWGVDNFGTNWGLVVVAPAGGAALWSAIFSAVYQHEVEQDRCYGPDCYNATFAGMTVAALLAMVLWGLAWRTWNSRGVPI